MGRMPPVRICRFLWIVRVLPVSRFLSISPQQPGPGGRCVCQSAVPAQGGGTLSCGSAFRFPTYGFPLRGALMRSGDAPFRRPPPPDAGKNAGRRKGD